MNQQLKEILDLFHRHNVAYWLDSGTLLGLMREGKMLKNDLDIDIGIWSSVEPKLKKVFPLLREAGYKIYSASYNKQIFQYKFMLNHKTGLRTIDINIFRELDGHAWCPMYYLKFKGGKDKSSGLKKIIFGGLRSIIHGCWKTINAKVFLRIDITRFPWSALVCRGTWWIPGHFFENIVYDSGLEASRPAAWEKYLEFRYGNWQAPSTDWVFYRDDRGIKNLEPAVIPGLDGGKNARHVDSGNYAGNRPAQK